MTDLPYPASEHIEGHIDYMSGDLTHKLMEQDRALSALGHRLEDTAEHERRWDEAICLLEWTIEKFPHQHSAVLTPKDVLEFLYYVALYAQTGRGCAWMDRAREGMGG